jgi:hypothetical protein
MVSHKSPSYPIVSKHEKKEEFTVLGPGRYDIKRNLSDNPKFSFGLDEKIKDDNTHLYEPGYFATINNLTILESDRILMSLS